jgi:hypothetical protein
MKSTVTGRGYSKRQIPQPETVEDLAGLIAAGGFRLSTIEETAAEYRDKAAAILKGLGDSDCDESELAERYGVDSLAHIAARIVRQAALLKLAASRGQWPEAVEAAIALGGLATLMRVYGSVGETAGRGGKSKPATPWAAYAARLVAKHPDATKKEIWRAIPERGLAEAFSGWEIYRDGDKLLAGGQERDIELSRRQFFDSYLRTREK